MKIRQILCLLCASALVLPVLVHAEMYKWKDKNGVTQYTHTPPPYGAKQLPFGNKKLRKDTAMQPTGREPLSQVIPDKQVAPAKAPSDVVEKDDIKIAKEKMESAAKKRQQEAEVEKSMKQEKEAQAKAKQERCNAAKASYETYKQGGKILKVTEKGERSYLDDNALKAGLEEARKQMDDFCN